MSKRTKRIWLIVGGVSVLVVVLVGFLVWWFVFRDDSPPPPDIESQSEVIAEEQNLDEAATPTDEATADPTAEAAEQTTTTTTTGAAESAGALTGTWTVDQTLGSFEDFTSSYAGYRVQEELARIGGNTAVGRTPEVTGEVVIDGTSITSTEVVVDMASLRSDSGGRDGRVRSTLEVDQFPTATFELTTPIAFSDIPAEDELLTIQASGDFTAHGVTNPVTVDLEARLVGEVIIVIGSFEISFDDYNVTPPSAATVLSVEDVATIEWQLNLTKQA